ncbi:P-loop containing nucleoside triphosphate hydrolase protein [Microthyrium microscopicum]|uniref:ATP-dependent RNA helicase n=1 Tax=Microthyrium microscopicum TaxID=703497 RepID=A0A6A6URJ1_9PEZI|nr:P-loop containing nucleoside triphosphate hydrolase protein [Microthyrium microscopicum]
MASQEKSKKRSGKKEKKKDETPLPSVPSQSISTLQKADISLKQAEDITSEEHTEGKPEKKSKKKDKKRKIEHSAGDGAEEDAPRSKRQQIIFEKFQKSSKFADKLRANKDLQEPEEEQSDDEKPELHDIVPLPQPAQVPEPEYKPTFSSLPSWLAEPIIVDPGSRKSFTELGLSSQLLENLKRKSISNAFAVQAALLPLLLPGTEQYQGDICVSAPTGSGKTLGYILPLVEALKEGATTQLRAIVVVPTRELVTQAKQELQLCVHGTNVKIATALGSSNLAMEQQQLISKNQRYDPEEAAKMHSIAKYRIESGFLEDDSLLEDARTLLPYHVPDLKSKIDVLVCTPGRLVEHIRSTPGFSLENLRYLVIDEADFLLDDSFQEWVEVILSAIETSKTSTSRYKFLAQYKMLQDSISVQKIILSATMTRDLTKLSALKLRRPTLVAISGTNKSQGVLESTFGNSEDMLDQSNAVELPPTLKEVAIPVGNGSEKPLYLLQLLETQLRLLKPSLTSQRKATEDRYSSASSDSSSSNSSDESPGSSDTSSEPLDSNDPSQMDITPQDPITSARPTAGTPRVLVFTNNNEDAMRLSHILTIMRPQYRSLIGTLTKTSSKSGQRTLSAFKSGKIAVLIASDRASRGLDVPDLTDVISYDMPRSPTLYIHRVGRTARAGKSGNAWSFFTKSEGRWFWNSIAKAPEIRRSGGEVDRLKIDLPLGPELREQYEAALEGLRSAVLGTG